MTRLLDPEFPFEAAAGGTVGRDHRHALKNSHDAWFVEQRGDVIVALVCDGCSSGPHSEVGAKIAIRIWADELFRLLGPGWSPTIPAVLADALGVVERRVLTAIDHTASYMGENFAQILNDYFLFTVLGAFVHRESYAVFAAGDGIVLTTHDCGEDGVYRLEAKDNKPVYPAYRLLRNREEPIVKVVEMGFAHVLRSVLIGTDGVADLMKSAEKPIPGKSDKIGPIEQFWRTDRFFKNPYAIGHRLNLINRTVSKMDYETRSKVEEHGPLTDDTSMAVIRRRREP